MLIMTIDFDTSAKRVKSPSKLAHVVLRTNNFKAMVCLYETFLGAQIIYENDDLAILSYDDEHHRVAITRYQELRPKYQQGVGWSI